MTKDLYSDYDGTAANNTDVGGVNIAEGCNFGNMNNMGRELMSHTANHFAEDTIASSGTTDLGSKAAHFLNISGTTTITALGTVKAGTLKHCVFADALTLTHNATSLILPGGANITTAADDTAVFVSEGSGNWRCLRYSRAASSPFGLVDEDDMSSDSAVDAPSQQSVKAWTTGQQTIWVPAGAMIPAITNGAAAGTLETTSNARMIAYLAFDPSTEESAFFGIQMPKSWDEGTIVAQFLWTHPATTTNFGVEWRIHGGAFSDDDALDGTFGTEVFVADTGGTTHDLYVTSETSAATLAGTPASEDFVNFRVSRQIASASDTLAVDAWLIGVKIHYTTNAPADD